MKKVIIVSLLTCFCACKSKTANLIKVSLTDSNRSVKFTGLDAAIIGEIARDSSNMVWQSLIPVYKMPADTNMKDEQPTQPGKYAVNNNAVIFTPDTPFLQHQTYFTRYYQYGEGNSALDYIDHSKKLRQPGYIDLIFKR
jgi:hypothetical protein